MARYQVVRERSGCANMALVSARSASQALERFAELKQHMLEGETLTVYDSVKGENIARSYKATAAEIEAMREDTLQRFVKELLARKKDIDKFAADLPKDPAHSLRWADRAFAATAQWMVGLQIEAQRAEGRTWQEIAKILQDAALGAARYPESSTSTCANLYGRYATQAMAEAAQRMAVYL